MIRAWRDVSSHPPRVFTPEGAPQTPDDQEQPAAPDIKIDGARRQAAECGRSRIAMCALLFLAGFTVACGRLVDLAVFHPADENLRVAGGDGVIRQRPDIVDRRGELLASDVPVSRLLIEGPKVWDADETADEIAKALPGVDADWLRARLHKKRYVEIRRDLSPDERDKVFMLGLPGVVFQDYDRRLYPRGAVAAHVVGHVNADREGVLGLERFIDRNARAGEEVTASIDLRVQDIVENELAGAIEKFSAQAGWGIVLDVETGEVLSLASLPDFDPNRFAEFSNDARRNRATLDVYELGSAFKAITVAAALETGAATLARRYDASRPFRIGGHTISDFHAKNRVLSLPEVIIHSSNIGSAQMALDVGVERHQAFLGDLGLLAPIETELHATRRPLSPSPWRSVNTATIAYGHGISVTPLHLAASFAAVVNGGIYVEPTFLKRAEGEARVGRRVISEQTSDVMRGLLRLVLTEGTAGRAEVDGYYVAGKTATAEKPARGGYDRKRLISSFVGVFPGHAPEYLVMMSLDEPKGLPETFGYATAGWTAAPLAGAVIERIGPVLGVRPSPLIEAGGEPALTPELERYAPRKAELGVEGRRI